MTTRASNALRLSEAAALDAWRTLIEADSEQVERLRQDAGGDDYYASIASRFRAGRRESPEWPVVAGLARPGDTWLDIGAGGGRFAVPLAGEVERVIAVEPSPSMRETLQGAAAEAGREVEVIDARWPVEDWSTEVDVSLAAHCLYDIGDLGPFLDAMEAATKRTCVAILGNMSRGAHIAPLFEAVHGEPMATLPAVDEFVGVLASRKRRYEVTTVTTSTDTEDVRPEEEAFAMLRRFLWLRPGIEADDRMQVQARERWGRDGGIALPVMRPWIGVVQWQPLHQEGV